MSRYSYSDRLTTDECKKISISFLKEHNYFSDIDLSGLMTWSKNGKQIASIAVRTDSSNNYVQLKYTHTNNQTEENTDIDYKIRLTTTQCNYGKERYWFECPLIIDGKSCNRRVGVLYLPNYSKYFGCRHCYNLTYTCQKEHNKTMDMFKYMTLEPKIEKLMSSEKLKDRRKGLKLIMS